MGKRMVTIHKSTSADSINYKYQEPSKNKKGEAKGIIYVKVDKKTGETKLKSAEGRTGYLMMKLRGYNRASEQDARNYLKSRFPDNDISSQTKNITTYDTSLYEAKDVVSSHKFEQAINHIVDHNAFIENFKNSS
ncbi:MAG: hypothetical protein ACOYL2_09810 [Burkholderiaceae bacterium]|jgi:hypothetical protein